MDQSRDDSVNDLLSFLLTLWLVLVNALQDVDLTPLIRLIESGEKLSKSVFVKLDVVLARSSGDLYQSSNRVSHDNSVTVLEQILEQFDESIVLRVLRRCLIDLCH